MNNSRTRLEWSRHSFDDGPVNDRSLLIGIAISIALVGLVLVFSGSITNYLNLEGFILVVGGSFGATLIQASGAEMRRAFSDLREALTLPKPDLQSRLVELMRIAPLVREQGAIAMDRLSRETSDSFFALSLELAAERDNPTEVKDQLELEMELASEMKQRSIAILQTMGGYAPAMGLIATLLGLIQMFANLKDPSSVGSAMSMALVATLYGAFISNMVFLPLAGKLRRRLDDEERLQRITLEGIVAILRRESTLLLEQRLRSLGNR